MITKAQQIDRVMNALGDKTRREILALLKKEAMPVGEIANRLPISRPAVSKHLRILENAGLVVYTTNGTRNIFRLNTNGFDTARLYVEEFWNETKETSQ